MAREEQALGSFTRQMKLDMIDMLRLGHVTPSFGAPLWGGRIEDAFDGNIVDTIATSEANPMVVTLAFGASFPFKQTRMVLAHEGTVKLELANTLNDLNAKTGSYVLAVNNQPVSANIWASWNFSATGKFVRASVTRPTADIVHLNEWELHANVTVNDITVVPSASATVNSAKMLTGKTLKLGARYADANKYTYPITDPQTWSSNNTGVANVDNSGRVTAGGTPGSTTLNVAANGVSQTVSLTTANSFTQTKDAARTKKVALVIRDPLVPQHGNLPLHQVYGWEDPNLLVPTLIARMASASGNTVNYKVVQTNNIGPSNMYTQWFGAPLDFNTLIGWYDQGEAFWRPQIENAGQGNVGLEYNQLLSDLGLCDKRNAGLIDEVWVYGDPYLGAYESRLAGPGTFDYNSPPLLGTACNRQLPIMGFNYAAGGPNAVHSFGHRIESVMQHAMGRWDSSVTSQSQNQNAWEKFTTLEVDQPGLGHVGYTHLPVNTGSEYQYDNASSVNSFEPNWQYYPFLQDVTSTVSCNNWGCSDDGYYQYMYGHMPRFAGASDRMLNNWWSYITDYLEATARARDLVLGNVGNVSLGFENTSWTASAGTKALDTTDGERTQGAASLKMTSVGSGVTLTSPALTSSAVSVANTLSVDVRVPTQLAGQSGAQVRLCLKSAQRGIPNYVCSAQQSLTGIGLAAIATFYTVPWTLPTATLNSLKAGSFTDLRIQVVLSGVPSAAQSATWLFDRMVFLGP